METVFIGQDEVPDLLPMAQCIEAVRQALADLAHGEGIQPLRPVMWLPEKVGALGMMPGYLGSIATMGIKTVTVFPGNAGTEYDSHQGTVMLFDASNGRLKAVVDATEITAIRTAAASAVATDLLARKDSSVLAILGAGVQGHSHLRAIPLVRPITEIRVWSRGPDNAARLAAAGAGDAAIRAVGSVAEAVAGADVVCTTTGSPEPTLAGSILEPGMHVNAVGSSVPFARELDSDAMARSRIFVDRRESTLNESGDFLMAQADGVVDEDAIVAEIGELVAGTRPGRESDDEITTFVSLGLAVEDIAAGDLVYRNALKSGKGFSFEFGGTRHG
ncbi:MAG TPA: ornithine cyclodeaminase family protein [Acidimicrobiia bacterium]|nr:ornithine cyclodeaminase family protein [Acidimicrobiia bacterium]